MIKAGERKDLPGRQNRHIVAALAAEGVSSADALSGVHISKSALSLPATRVSLNQVVQCYGNAARLALDPEFAYRAGLRFHVSTYGMYGFAILSSMNFRQTMNFAEQYHELATPLADLSFKEESKHGVWTIAPIAHPQVNASLYKFLVELHFGILLSLHRDALGPSFAPQELHATYGPPDDTPPHVKAFGAGVLCNRPENRFVFDAAWLDAVPKYGNEITYSTITKLCDELLEEIQLRVGLAGRVREVLLVNLMRPTSFEATAKHLGMSPRTLRRKLNEDNTSYRALVDELRMHVAIKYLRGTDLTIEDISASLGFSDGANFRHAFRRWTKRAPLEFRDHSKRRA